MENFVFLSRHKAVRKETSNSPRLPSPPVVVPHVLTEHLDVLQKYSWTDCDDETDYLPLLQAYLIVFLSFVAKQNSVFLLT